MIPAYVINLDRSPGRLAAMARQLDALGLPWRRWPAVDGATLSDARLAEVYDEAGALERVGRPVGRAEIGCYLSHRAVLADVAAGEAPVALVLEDDALLFPALVDLIGVIDRAQGAPMSWGVLNLGALNPEAVGSPLRWRRVLPGWRLRRAHGLVFGAGAYLVRRDAARALLARSVPIRMPFDYFWDPVREPWLDLALISPPMAVFPPDSATQSLLELERVTLRPSPAARRTWRGRLIRRLVSGRALRTLVEGHDRLRLTRSRVLGELRLLLRRANHTHRSSRVQR